MKDFIRNLGITLKEPNEARVWLKMVRMRAMVPSDASGPVFQECVEVCRIHERSGLLHQGPAVPGAGTLFKEC